MKFSSYQFKALALGVLGLFTLQSCNDSATAMLEDGNYSSTEDAILDEMEGDCGPHGAFEFGDEMRGPDCGNMLDHLPDCAIVTESGDGYPKTIKIEFGDDCVEENGHKPTGTITILISDDMKNQGATKTITVDHSGNEEHSMKSTTVIENIGKNASGNYVYHRTTSTEGAGKRGDFVHTSSGEMEWLQGFDTEDCDDNIVSITGSSSMTRDGEVVMKREIVKAIVKDAACEYPISGIVKITGSKGESTTDFGDGSCDAKVIITRDGNTREVDMSEMKKHSHHGKRRPRK